MFRQCRLRELNGIELWLAFQNVIELSYLSFVVMKQGIGAILFVIFYLRCGNFIGHFIALKMFQSKVAAYFIGYVEIANVNIIVVIYLCVNIALVSVLFSFFQIIIGKFIKTLAGLRRQIHTKHKCRNANYGSANYIRSKKAVIGNPTT